MTSLRRRMLEDMQVRNLSPHTQTTYVQHVARFARHFQQSPEALGPEEIRAYQLYLTTDRKLAVASVLIAVAALRFLYTVTLKQPWRIDEVLPVPHKPQRLPVVLSPDEVLQCLDGVPGLKHRAILTTCYAAGLRISEVLHLRPRDIDSRRMVIRVEQGKGQQDRYLRDALTHAPGAPPHLVARGPSDHLALPGWATRAGDQQGGGGTGVSEGPATRSDGQTPHSAFAASRLRRTSA